MIWKSKGSPWQAASAGGKSVDTRRSQRWFFVRKVVGMETATQLILRWE
jgi:hypothetical protein